jgi:hypothetical protein
MNLALRLEYSFPAQRSPVSPPAFYTVDIGDLHMFLGEDGWNII